MDLLQYWQKTWHHSKNSKRFVVRYEELVNSKHKKMETNLLSYA